MKKDLYTDICDERLFQSLYEKYAKTVHDYLYYKYGDRLNPADKTQDAFIKLWENCSKVSPDKAKSFLYTVANNLMLNETKHQKVVLKHQKSAPKNQTTESPEFILEQNQYFAKYQEALSKLTEEQRSAFLLNKAEGKKHEEIAEILGVTRKVVEYRIYTAFKILKEELDGFNLK